MLKYNILDLQNKLGKPIKRHYQSLGLDLATKSGWALVTTNTKTLTIDYGFINIDTKDTYVRFNEYVKALRELIKPEQKVIIEDCYFSVNALVIKFLAKLEGIAYAICKINKVVEEPIFIGASSARKEIGCKGNTKKPEVHKWIIDNLNIDIKDEDASDAIILALVGVLEK